MADKFAARAATKPIVAGVNVIMFVSATAWRSVLRAIMEDHTFGDSSINFTVILRAKEFVDRYLIKHEFVKRLHTRFNQESIVIPFPIRTIAYRHPLADAREEPRESRRVRLTERSQ